MKCKLFATIILWLSLKGQIQSRLPTTVPIDLYNIGLIRLDEERLDILSAPPFVVLDIEKLSNSSCFINFRTKKYNLGIPIIFWNYKYLDKINEKLVGLPKMLPPTGNVSFQIDWRRPNVTSDKIKLNTTWYKSHINFYLPMTHDFIMEFDSDNSSRELCEDTKDALIKEPLQRQELIVRFRKREELIQKGVNIGIHCSYITQFEPIKSGCSGQKNCYILQSNVETVSAMASVSVIRAYYLVNFNVHEKVTKMVYDYLCETVVSYMKVRSQKVVGSSTYINDETEVCMIPNDLIYYLNNQKNEFNKIVLSLHSYPLTKESEFEIPIVN